jgi:hypothetical protein
MNHKSLVLVDKTDIKIFVLCLLDEINHPMTYTAIVDTVVDSGCVGGFDFSECFSRLVEDGHVIGDTLGSESYYMIDETGHMVAAELRDTLSPQVREKLHVAAVRHLELAKMGVVLTTDIREEENGRYRVSFRINEGARGEMLHLAVTTPDLDTAERMRAHCEGGKRDAICRSVMAIITGQMDYFT